MRIGIDIRNIGKKRTGDEAVFLNLVRNLAKIDSENEYFLFTDITDTPIIQFMGVRLGIEGKENFKIISLKTSNKFTWNFWTLSNYLRKNPVDIYHTQYILPFFVPKKIKLITHIHDVSFLVYPQHIRPLDLFFLKTLIPRSIRKASKVLTVSDFSKDEIMKYYKTPAEKIAVIPNAVGGNFEREFSEEELGAIRKRYDLPEKYLLYVGTLQPRKNIPFLIEVFARLKDKLPDYKLVLVGSRSAHNYDSRIEEAIAKHELSGRVLFPGYVESAELPALYRLAALFVFPSLYEGFGIPLLETFAAGTPAVAAGIPSLREVGGDASIYFDPLSLDKAAEIIYNAIDSPEMRRQAVDSGKSRIAFYSWRRSAEKLLDIYKSF